MIKQFFVLTLASWGVLSSPIKHDSYPSCQSCHPVSPDKINVHLIPHSHDDVGWLKTVDQYYYGSHSEIQRAGVQYIISSTVEALKANPDRRFVQVETAFFWKWWQHQSDSVKEEFIKLVNNGQLEIINAAWSMNDEAATNYQSTIDQFTLGLGVINDTVGPCGAPRIGWQIDPFGHSREQASIFAQLGYDGVFFARIDYNDKEQRIKNKTMEVIWRGSANLNGTDIFTNVFPEFYGSPDGFCFDIECGDEVLNDDNSSPDYNVPRRVDTFLKKMEVLATFYQTSNLLIPMGGDFQYQAAEKNFVNMDKLIEGAKSNDKFNIIYSTPSCYIKAVNEEATSKGITFPVKVDDYFPYGSDSHCYWTGYFTSRPNAKRFERTANNILQAGKQLAAFAKVKGVDQSPTLALLQQAVGVLQHHDAITGTAKEAVADDYARLLTKGVKRAEPVLDVTITDLLKKDKTTEVHLHLQTCLMANVSICEVTNSRRFLVTVYNPLERPVTHYVRIPVPEGTYKITGPDGEEAYDLLDAISDFGYIDSKFGSPNPKELVFAAKNLKGFGVKMYYVEKVTTSSPAPKLTSSLQFGTETTGFEIDEQTGLLKSVTMNGVTVDITQQFLYYKGFNGDNDIEENRASGAYILRPLENNATPISHNVTTTSTTGQYVDEVRQQINDWVTQIIRVYKGEDSNYIEFDWLVGPIEVDHDNEIGREIISRFTIDGFSNKGIFFTDSNGREMIKRELNKRYDYEYNSTLEPVASNYYPVTSKIVIRDEADQLKVAVLNDRAQGGSSLQDGVIELMVHRRLLKDDAKGVGEPLDDEEFSQGVVARGQHYLIVGSAKDSGDGKSTAAQERELALKKLLQPVVLFGDASSDDLTLDNVQNMFNFEVNNLKTALPENVHILTLEPWKEDTYILRLEHILEKNEDNILSQSATVDLTDLFTLFNVTEIRETTLGANQWLDEFEARKKYEWKIKGAKADSGKTKKQSKTDLTAITLEPMQIRTFIIKVQAN